MDNTTITEEKMEKTLEIGRNYADIFGAPEGAGMIYNGGNSWTQTAPDGRSQTIESDSATANATAYINRPSHGTGLR